MAPPTSCFAAAWTANAWGGGTAPKPLALEAENKATVHHSVIPFLGKNTLDGKEVFIAGGSDGAAKEALTLAKLVGEKGKVRMVQDQPTLLCVAEFKERILAAQNIEVITSAEIVECAGKTPTEITTVTIKNNTGEMQTFTAAAGTNFEVFAFIGQTPATAALNGVVELANGYAATTNTVETNIPGVYAAGDCAVKTVRQMATAVSDGALAAIAAFQYVQSKR